MRRLFLLAALLFLASPAWAGIAFDAAASAQSTAGATSLTYTHTVGAGLSNGILVVGVSSGNPNAACVTVSTITYNGVSLTQIRADTHTDVSEGGVDSELWYLLAPASGVHSVVVTMSGAASGNFGVGSVSFSGVDQVSPIDAQNGGFSTTGGQTSVSHSVTTVANNAWVMDNLMFSGSGGSATATVGGTQTQQWNLTMTFGYVIAAGSTLGPITPAGSTAISWTVGSGNATARESAHSVVSLKPSGGARLSKLPLLGVGAILFPLTIGCVLCFRSARR
jgi:hypothetical protein